MFFPVILYPVVVIVRLVMHLVFIIFFSVQYIIALTLFLIFFIIGLVLQSSFLVYYFTQSILKDGSKRIYHTLSGLLLWIISTKVCVIREPRYQRATSGRSPTVDFVNSSVSNTCERCTNLVDRSALVTGTTLAVTRPVEYFSHHTRDALEISARDCHLCNLLLRSIAKWSSGYGTTNVQSDRDEDLTIKVWEKREIFGKPRLRVQVTARYGSEPLEIEELHYVRQRVAESSDTSSPTILRWAKEQLESCKTGVDGHENCQNYFVPNEERNVLPTRILDVGQNESANVRLLHTSTTDVSQPLEYVAFSHCWGQHAPKPSRLVRCPFGVQSNSLHVHYQYYPEPESPLLCDVYLPWENTLDIGKLSKNIQHAISIARGIGCRYLWIDSLCIIQDDETDKALELKRMGLIYANAMCTISATASPNSNGGCFHQTNSFLGECILRQQGDRALIATFPGNEETPLGKLFQEKVEEAPLTSRAWAFQERVLASRVLHFCDGAVLFECNKLQAASCHSYSMPYPRKKYIQADGKLVRPLGPPQPPPPPHRPFPHFRILPSLPGLISPPSLSIPPFLRHQSPSEQYPDVEGQRDTHNENEQYPNVSRSVQSLLALQFPPSLILPFNSYIPNFDGYIDTFHAFKDYAAWRPETVTIIDPKKSARIGMRGEFEMLATFRGTSLQEKLSFHESWYELVERYSIRNLSAGGKDKVFAIEGIASFITKSGNFTFVAGLWKEFLPFNLLWLVTEDELRKRPDRLQPTWSWASVDGRISCRPQGKSRSWKVTQSTPLLKIQVQEQRRRKPNKIAETSWETITILISGQDVYHESRLELRGSVFKFNPHNIHYYPDVDSEEDIEALLCLPILSLESRVYLGFKQRYQIRGIILSKEATKPRAYRRVGYFWTKDRNMEQAALGKTKALIQIM